MITTKAHAHVIRGSNRTAIELHSPVQGKLKGYVDANRKTKPLMVVAPGTFRGHKLALCGAGPSLVDNLPAADDAIFACNSALPYLWDRGVKVTAGVGIDQTPMLEVEWQRPPPVAYYCATSCDPSLIRHLQQHDRPVIFFHNAVGFEDEFEHYCRTWPPMFMVGQGATVVSRFIGVAEWMGFEHIDIYGADCAFAEGDITHANGRAATSAYVNPVYMVGDIDGREWRTRPDMLMAAVELVRRARESEGRIRLIGDTLPNALMDKDDEFLDLVCRRLAPGEQYLTA